MAITMRWHYTPKESGSGMLPNEFQDSGEVVEDLAEYTSNKSKYDYDFIWYKITMESS